MLARTLGILGVILTLATTAWAEPIKVGYTAAGDFFPLFIAKEEGFFSKRGLDVEPVLLTLNSVIPQALMADSLQIGGPTASVFLQAVEGGIDLVAIAGNDVTGPGVSENTGVLARPDVTIRRPQDFVGKTVGVPGLGAFLHVLFVHWLQSKGVDPKQVTFVEVAFFNMNDALKSSSVDAVLTGEPIMSRIVEARTARVAFHYIEDLPSGQSILLFATMRGWAEKNAAVARQFKAAIGEADQFALAHPDRARALIAKYTKLSSSLTAKLELGETQPDITAGQLAWWVDIMRGNDMLESAIDIDKLIFH